MRASPIAIPAVFFAFCASFAFGAHAEPRIVLGGTGGLPSLVDPTASTQYRSAADTGFYLHYSATDPTLFGTVLGPISKVFQGKPVIAEVSLGGGFTSAFWSNEWRTHVLAYGFSPKTAVVNVAMATYEAAAGAPPEEVAQFEAFVAAARTDGKVEVLAPVISPNSSGGVGTEGDAKTLSIRHPWSDPWWDRLRAMAKTGGGITFDAPPAFFLHGLPSPAQTAAYQAFTIAGLRWAAQNHLWSAFIVSPYFDGPTFQADSENLYRTLLAADALPQTWIVENYNECGPPYKTPCTKAEAAFLALVGREDQPETEASVALWFARHAKTAK